MSSSLFTPTRAAKFIASRKQEGTAGYILMAKLDYSKHILAIEQRMHDNTASHKDLLDYLEYVTHVRSRFNK